MVTFFFQLWGVSFLLASFLGNARLLLQFTRGFGSLWQHLIARYDPDRAELLHISIFRVKKLPPNVGLESLKTIRKQMVL